MWDMIREQSDCTFFIITKRPERILDHLPADWDDDWNHVTIAVTTENQWPAYRHLPIYLSIPMKHYAVMIKPLLSTVNLHEYFTTYTRTDSQRQTSPLIGAISVGGESGPDARICDYAWVLNVHMQCVEYSVPFSFHQTGARLKKGDKIYDIPREHHHE